MSMIEPPLCVFCKHFMQGTPPAADNKAFFCNAFPNEVPPEILSSQHDHVQSFDGDNGVTFELSKEEDLPDLNTHRKKLGFSDYNK